MADTGYSATPLAAKLGVKPGYRLVVRHAPAGWGIPNLPPDVTQTADNIAHADVALAFYRTRADLAHDAGILPAFLPPTASLWVLWPRKAAGHASDITENVLRELLLPSGLVDVKVAAVGEDWSGLKFVWRKTPMPD
ncbi:MAG: DUF3052 domain-containing protein [Streptomycetaceae bacterium]|nr:DUF3052 domain-containing protein [Streptomycetaceae bacterium]